MKTKKKKSPSKNSISKKAKDSAIKKATIDELMDKGRTRGEANDLHDYAESLGITKSRVRRKKR